MYTLISQAGSILTDSISLASLYNFFKLNDTPVLERYDALCAAADDNGYKILTNRV